VLIGTTGTKMADTKLPPLESLETISHKYASIRINPRDNTMIKAINLMTKTLKEHYKNTKVQEGDIVRIDISHLR